MWNCKVCKTDNNDNTVCRRCGFDPSRDYEAYPTFASFDASSEMPVAERKRSFILSINPNLWFCDYCGGFRFYYDPEAGKLICCECGKPILLPRNEPNKTARMSAAPEPVQRKDSRVKPAEPVEKPLRLSSVVPISIGFNHIVGILNDGSVIAAGNNFNGQCDVGNFRGVIAVCAGTLNTVALRSDGTVASAGFIGSRAAAIDSWSNIVSVAAAKGFAVGLRADGTVCTTEAPETRLGSASKWTNVRAIAACSETIFGVQADGKLLTTLSSASKKINAASSDWKNAVRLFANSSYLVGLKADGTLLSLRFSGGISESPRMNLSKLNDLMDPDSEPIKQVPFKEWTDIVDLSLCTNKIVGLRGDGTVVTDSLSKSGVDDLFDLSDVSDWKDICAVAAGDTYTLGLKKDGSVVIAGITTLDNYLNLWNHLLVPHR